MSELDRAEIHAYVEAAAALAGMVMQPERAAAVAAVMSRIAEFAADLNALELGDHVEVAGIFRP